MAADDKRRPALGRGLGALLPGGAGHERRGYHVVGVEQIHPAPHQPRRRFDEQAIEELATSIREKGILQPILVRRLPSGDYRIIAGERRWRAAQRAGLREVPVLVREASDKESFELALIENIQREELNPVEEAEAFHRLIEEHRLSHDALADRIGKERSTVSNALRLLRLPDPVKEALVEGSLSMGHARALLTLESDSDLQKMAARVAREKLSVRALEQLVRRKQKGRRLSRHLKHSPAVVQLVEQMQRALQTRVELRDREGEGVLEIHYQSYEQLEYLSNLLRGRR